jgi:hypothetical protein
MQDLVGDVGALEHSIAGRSFRILQKLGFKVDNCHLSLYLWDINLSIKEVRYENFEYESGSLPFSEIVFRTSFFQL